MTKNQKIILNVLFIIAVPTVVTASYYGYKGIKSYIAKKKLEQQTKKEEEEKETVNSPQLKNNE